MIPRPRPSNNSCLFAFYPRVARLSCSHLLLFLAVFLSFSDLYPPPKSPSLSSGAVVHILMKRGALFSFSNFCSASTSSLFAFPPPERTPLPPPRYAFLICSTILTLSHSSCCPSFDLDNPAFPRFLLSSFPLFLLSSMFFGLSPDSFPS